MKIYCLQHVNFEAPGNILKWAKERNYNVTSLLAYQSPKFPLVSEVDLLIVMGGPMSVNETSKYPWLIAEKKFLNDLWNAGKKIVGVCLGAQLLAEMLGATVTRNTQSEIGYHPLTLTDEGKKSSLLKHASSSFEVFHWHSEIFELPPGATLLAKSAITPHQLFLWKNQLLGIQFHPEVCSTTLESMIKNCSGDLKKGDFIQSIEEMRRRVFNDQESYLFLCQLLEGFLSEKL